VRVTNLKNEMYERRERQLILHWYDMNGSQLDYCQSDVLFIWDPIIKLLYIIVHSSDCDYSLAALNDKFRYTALSKHISSWTANKYFLTN